MSKKNLDSYYGTRLDKYGSEDARSCGYVNNESHTKRSEYAIDLIVDNFEVPLSRSSYLLDFGVGPSYRMYRDLPALTDKIRDKSGTDCEFIYTGIERSESVMAQIANELGLDVNQYSISEDSLVYSLDDLRSEEFLGLSVKYNVVLCNGVLQDFYLLSDIYDHIKKLSGLLSPEGILVLIVPSNQTGASDIGETYLSPYDLLEVARSIGLPYKLEYGQLGKHLSLVIKNTTVK